MDVKKKICPVCKKIFEPPNKTQKTCSRKCGFTLISGKNSKKWKNGKWERNVEKVCLVCGEKFTARGKQVTCSHSCAMSYFRTGENNSRWKNGISIYRELCLTFHDHQCIICKEDKILEAHHLDRDKTNNTPENLIPLCPTHHRYCHSKFRNLVEPLIEKYLKRYKKDHL